MKVPMLFVLSSMCLIFVYFHFSSVVKKPEKEDILLYEKTASLEVNQQNSKTEPISRAYNNILVVTLYQPTTFMLERAKDYQRFRSSSFDVWYIFDMTTDFEFPDEYKKYFKENVYTFKSSEFIKTYPKMKDLLKNCQKQRFYKRGEEYRYLAYLTMAEKVNELYHLKKLRSKYLWVVEQDASITGNLTKLMDYFDNNYDQDFIGRDLELIFKSYSRRFWNNYYFTHCLSDSLKDYLTGKQLYMSHIFFSRFSSMYMSKLNQFFLNGYHGNSELVYPTVAYLNNLKISVFPKHMLHKNCTFYTNFSKADYLKIKDKEMFIHFIKD